MRAGRFTEKMTVQKVVNEIDQFGGVTEYWSERYIDVWCQPSPIGSSAAGGGEYNEDLQQQADTKYEFVCRYLPGLEYTDRILWSGGYFDIYQIFPIGKREGMKIRGSWSDDQGDGFAMGAAGTTQTIADTGLTIDQLVEAYNAGGGGGDNGTGLTEEELATYYTDTEAAIAPTSQTAPQLATYYTTTEAELATVGQTLGVLTSYYTNTEAAISPTGQTADQLATFYTDTQAAITPTGQTAAQLATYYTDTEAAITPTGQTAAQLATYYTDTEAEIAPTGETVADLVTFYNDNQPDTYSGFMDTSAYTDIGAAYSVRRLGNAYTGPCMNVHRTSDGTTQDIGFDSDGYIDVTALESFCAGTDGKVKIWYDQSGSNNHLTQDTPANMPIVVKSGTAVTTNGFVSIQDNDEASGNNSSTMRFTGFGLGNRYCVSIVGNTVDYPTSGDAQVAFTTFNYNASTDAYVDSGYQLAAEVGGTSSSMATDANVWKNGTEYAAYGSKPTRTDLFNDMNTYCAVGMTLTNTASNGVGLALGYRAGAKFSIWNYSEFILFDNASYGYSADGTTDHTFVAAVHGDQQTYFNIT